MTSRLKPVSSLLLFLLLNIAGCDSSNTDPTDDYLERLENVLDAPASTSTKQALAFPAPRELLWDQEDSLLSVREFLSLRQCPLHVVIAHRNSLMGKVATPSQLLFSDLRILDTGPACVLLLEQNNQKALAAKLKTFLAYKQSMIGHRLWQAILGSPENAKFWSSSGAPDNYPDKLDTRTLQDIKALTSLTKQVLQGQYRISDDQATAIERHLGNLRYGDAGHLMRAFADLSATLERADTAVLTRLDRPLCLQPQPTTQARYLKNVVSKFFVPLVQQRAVKLAQRYQQLLPAYLELEKMLAPYAAPAYLTWSQMRQARFDQYLNATRSHVDLLQSLFRQCGLTPGNSTG